MGCGCVMRDSMRLFISARASTARVKLQPHEAEALSVREALSWVKQDHRSNIIVETDYPVVFHASSSSLDATSPFGMIIEDCQALANSMDHVCFAFV